jgi:hypothetical protein
MQNETIVAAPTRGLMNTIKRLDRANATILNIMDDRGGLGIWRIKVDNLSEKAAKRFDVVQSTTI